MKTCGRLGDRPNEKKIKFADQNNKDGSRNSKRRLHWIITVHFYVDHLGLPIRSYTCRSDHATHPFLLPDWLIRSAAAEEAIGSTPTPLLGLGVRFHRRCVSALVTLTDTRVMAPTGVDKCPGERGRQPARENPPNWAAAVLRHDVSALQPLSMSPGE